MASILNVDKIRANGSTTDALTIDSSGRVSHPQKPAFSVYKTSNQSITAHTTTTVTWDTETLDWGGGFDLANNKFVAPLDGVYQFNVKVQSNTTNGLHIKFRRNQTNYGGDAWVDFGDVSGATSSEMMKLDAGDEVDVQVYMTVTGTVNSTRTRFDGFFVG